MISIAVFLLSLTPGLYAWIKGKRLIGLPMDDPLLAERLMAFQTKVYQINFLCMIAVCLLDHWGWALLTVVMMLAGAFPVRKALFGETWNFATYLYFRLRIFLAFNGLLFLIGFTPILIGSSGPWRWLEIVILSVVLFGWLFFGQQVFFRLLGAKPLSDMVTKSRFVEMIERSSVERQPQLMQADFPGGRIINAFVLPSTGQPAVLFTRTLLEELSAEESDAIFAHELAHLEHMDHRYVKRLVVLYGIVIILALAIVPLADMMFGMNILDGWKLFLTGILLMAVLVITISHGRRRHESESDRRAIALCGNADVLAQALERLHKLSHLPRRLSLATEQASTHPSLANRIRHIQEGVDRQYEVLTAPVVLTSPDSGRFIIVDSEKIHWLDGVSENSLLEPDALKKAATSITSHAYSELKELLIKPSGKQGAILFAVTRKGKKQTIVLAEDELPLAQSSLDKVDIQLAKAVGSDELQHQLLILLGMGNILANIWATFTLIMVPLAFFMLARPRVYTLAAIALSSLCAILLELFQGAVISSDEWLAVAVSLALSVITLAYIGIRNGKMPNPRRADFWWLFGTVLLFTAINWVMIGVSVFNDFSSLRLHQAALSFTVAATGLFALAGLVAVTGSKQVRMWIASLLLLVGMRPVIGQSSYFGAWVGHDLFAASPSPLRWKNRSIEPSRQIALENVSGDIKISPQANWITYRTFHEEDDGSGPFHFFKLVGQDNRSTEIRADKIVFVDEQRLLKLIISGKNKGLQLLVKKPNGWKPQNQWPLPSLEPGLLALDYDRGNWRVLGRLPNNQGFILLTGALEKEAVTAKKFPFEKGHSPAFQPKQS